MENLCRRFILSVAIFSCAVQLTMAAVNAIDCTTNGNTDCVDHSTCVNNLCKCDSAYKDGNTSPDTCVPKGLGDLCDKAKTNADCVAVSNSVCKDVGGTDKCACDGKFKESSGQCVQKGLGDQCDTGNQNADCAAVSNAVCIDVSGTDKCACAGKYKESGGQCVEKGLGNSCSAVSDCSAVTGATCTASACACGGSYKVDPADNTKCKLKGLDDICGADADCTNVTNSECSTGPPRTCVCSDDYTAINNLCKKGLGNTCSSVSDCSAVSNAGCAGAAGSEVCTCETNYKEDNGQCSSANGLQTLLSVPVALLLSFLTIAVTRVH